MNDSNSYTCALAMEVVDRKLTPEEDIKLREHVESCPECLQRLEQAAAAAALDDLRLKVETDGLDAELQTLEDFSLADFVVEFLEPATEPEFIGSLANYDIVEVIGRGGMGIVLKGVDRELKRFVAIKAMDPHLASQPVARKRFAREAQAAAAVVHLNVIAIHHVQPNGRIPFIVMPLLGGESVADRLRREGALELTEVLRIGRQVASGLSAAHEQGLVHRDVKPSNILLEKGVERAVLTDFGLARAVDDVSLTRSNTIAGTPEFMSPEAVRGESVDARSDLFSLGCVLYTMASGVSPFRADSTMASLRNVTERHPQSLAALCPRLPPWFVALVERLLEKDPSHRFGSAREVGLLLERGLGSLQHPAEVSPPKILSRRNLSGAPRSVIARFFSNRNRNIVTATVATVFLALIAMALFANAPDISGQWFDDNFGRVTLRPISSGKYVGEYTINAEGLSGTLHLQWSARHGKYVGTWNTGPGQYGELTLKAEGKDLRGARNTHSSIVVDDETRLSDLHWTRSPSETNTNSSRSTRKIPTEVASAQTGQQRVNLTNVDGHAVTKRIANVCSLMGIELPQVTPNPNDPMAILISPNQRDSGSIVDWLLLCDVAQQPRSIHRETPAEMFRKSILVGLGLLSVPPEQSSSIRHDDQRRLRVLKHLESQLDGQMSAETQRGEVEDTSLKREAILNELRRPTGTDANVRQLQLIQSQQVRSRVIDFAQLFALEEASTLINPRSNSRTFNQLDSQIASWIIDLAAVQVPDSEAQTDEVQRRRELRSRLLIYVRTVVEARIEQHPPTTSFDKPRQGSEGVTPSIRKK